MPRAPTGAATLPETADPPFEVLEASGGRRPVLAHIPHASVRIPPAVRAAIRLDDRDLRRELVALTDAHTDDLFAWLGDHGATRFVNRRSRLVVDPERFSDPDLEPTEALGQGVVYTRTSDGRVLREADARDRAALIDTYYRPYHAALDAAALQIVETFGRCTLLDCHSFPTDPLPSERDRSPDRPDICIGRDRMHTPVALATRLADAFRAEGLSVTFDRPFDGTMVPNAFHGRDLRLRSVMIEVRRGLYMDEATGERAPGYDAFRTVLERAVVASGVLA
jgi:N-formylglutamate amidohydrolase